jgi:hypothetical protein
MTEAAKTACRTVEILGKKYDVKCLSERCRFFKAVFEADPEAEIPTLPFDCREHIKYFMKALDSPEDTIICHMFSDFLSLCYLAAFYGAEDLLWSLFKWIRSTLAEMPLQKATILKDARDMDLPRLASDFRHVEVASLSEVCKEGKRRLDKFQVLIYDFFDGGCEEVFDWQGLCGTGPDGERLSFDVYWIEDSDFWADYVVDRLTNFMNCLMDPDVRTACDALEDPACAGIEVDFHVPSDEFCSLNRGQKVFLRPCYRAIWGEMRDFRTVRKRCDLNGSPGLGKSVFAIYLLYQLANDPSKRQIIYVREDWGHFVAEFDESDGKWKCTDYGSRSSDLKLMMRSTPFIVVDGLDDAGHAYPEPVEVPGNSSRVFPTWFVIGSPKCHSPKKTGHNPNVGRIRQWYLPLWKPDEFTNLMKLCTEFKTVPDFRTFVGRRDEEMNKWGILPDMKRTQVFGLNPRSVLFETDTAIVRLCDALTDAPKIRETFGFGYTTTIDPTNPCHRLVFLEPHTNMRSATPIPITQFVLEQICRIVGKPKLDKLRNQVRKLVPEVGTVPNDQSVFGGLYERLGHMVFKVEGQRRFQIQELGHDGRERVSDSMELSLVPWRADSMNFNPRTWKTMPISKGVYYQPTVRSNCANLDSFALTKWKVFHKGTESVHSGVIAFQMTVGARHWIGHGPVAREEFVAFVNRALAISGARQEGGDVLVQGPEAKVQDDEFVMETEANEVVGTGAESGDESAPWLMFVVPNTADFVGMRLTEGLAAGEAFCEALTKVRFFVMELPVDEDNQLQGRDPDKADKKELYRSDQ